MTLKLKSVLQAFCFYSGFAYLVFLFNRPMRRVRILLYHRVNDLVTPRQSIAHRLSVHTRQFEKQMAFLSRHFRVLSLESLVSLLREGKPLPRKGVVLTFDDGYGDNARVAAPILRKYGFPATVFVTTGMMDGKSCFWWDRLETALLRCRGGRLILKQKFLALDMELNTPEDRIQAFWILYHQLRPLVPAVREESLGNLIRFLDVPLGEDEMEPARTLRWEELMVMADQGFSSGAHTHSHAVLAGLPEDRAENEVVLAKSLIEKNLQRQVTLFAYPVGNANSFGPGTEQLLRKHGFLCGVTTIEGTVKQGDDPYRLKRINIDGLDSLSAFRCKVMGVNSMTKGLFRRLKRKQKTHGPQEKKDRNGMI